MTDRQKALKEAIETVLRLWEAELIIEVDQYGWPFINVETDDGEFKL